MLEAAGSVAIVLIIIMTSYKICIYAKKNMAFQKNILDEREALNAVCSEVKYNISFDELKNCLEDKHIVIKYTDDFLERLSNDSLINLENARENEDKIVVKLLNEDNGDLNLKIQLINGSKVFEEEIRKGQWMDYV